MKLYSSSYRGFKYFSVKPSLPIVNFEEDGQSISFSSFFEGIPLRFVKHFTNTGVSAPFQVSSHFLFRIYNLDLCMRVQLDDVFGYD